MAGQVEICNLALTKVGDDRIISIDDDTERARVLKALWATMVDLEIRARNWNFAMARASLAALLTTPTWGFGTEYQLPADCLRVVQVSDMFLSVSTTDYRGSQEHPFQIEGRKILTDLDAPLKIRYLKRVTDTTLWDAMFVQAFACRLAHDACEKLSQNTTKKQSLAEQYTAAVIAAAGSDAIENPPDFRPDDAWVMVRV